jgi:hypothetical protein
MRAELVALVGPWAYAQVAGYLDERVAAGTPLPHPAVRRTEERAPS